jgi:hypothetical protein
VRPHSFNGAIINDCGGDGGIKYRGKSKHSEKTYCRARLLTRNPK